MQEAATTRSPFRHWVWSVGFVLTLAAVFILAVHAYRTGRRTELTREFLARTGQVLQAAQHLEITATRMEANQRGFLIAGSDDLARARDRDYAQALADIARLRRLVREDATQLRRLRDIEQALQARHARMLETSAIAAARGLPAARAAFNPRANGFDAARVRLVELRAAEQEQLVQFSAAAGSGARRFSDVLTLGTLLALLLLLASGAALWLQLQRGERLRRELARSNALQRAVLESAGLMVIATDERGLITVFNHAACEALGYQPDEMIGRRDLTRLHRRAELEARAEALSREFGEPVEPGFEAVVAHARRGITDVDRWTYVRRDGRPLRVQLAVSAVRDPAGELRGFVGIAHDITAHELAHEQLRLSEKRVRAIIETASDAFIAIDAAGVVEDWNPQAERMLGWSRTEAIGRRLSELIIPERYRLAHENGLRRYLVDGYGPVLNRRVEISALDRSGRELPVELTIWPMHSDSQVTFNAFIQDITERKQAQEAIRALNAELTAQADELALTNRELESFSYSVSHDLRAPLRHMSGYAQILREDAAGQLDASMLRYLDEIAASARRMGMLIDDLLAFSRLSRQSLTLIPVDMNAVVKDALADAGTAQNPEARIDIGPLPQAQADPVLLRQVWSNLLSNAVKYSAPRGAQAHIEVSGERGDTHVRYRVRDNGVGFDPRYADKLFGVFQRLHAQDEFEGTGVGLAIVHRIVARHRGHIAAQAQPGLGAEFTFELPIVAATGESA